MEEKLKKLNEIYDNIKVPDKLDEVVHEALKKGKNGRVISMNNKRKKNSVKGCAKTIGLTAASLIVALGISVNASAEVAQAVSKIPILSSIAKVITFREYNIDNEASKGSVKIPEVADVSNKEIEEKINKMIKVKVEEMVKEQEQLDKEYKEAYLETGGKEEDYKKVETKIGYNKHYITDKLISFDIYKYQTLAPAYDEVNYYNIDVSTGKVLTLKDILKDDFVDVKDNIIKEMNRLMNSNEDEERKMKESLKYSKEALKQSKSDQEKKHIEATIKSTEEKIKNKDYSQIKYDTDYVKDMKIDDNRPFYINKDGYIMFVFNKYEVASGSMGRLEFKIGSIK
ncbi:DUF3298 domain-containing protein [Clostridiaceae bacterium M8S5]|nr:DUF3298 domain-containing protein [Clostridiaceae bacterium M8S5]